MLKNYSDLHALARDALQEIGNIGTGNALTALSSMIHQTIHLQTPAVRIVPYQDAQELLGGAQTVKVGILIETSGDMNGIFMFLLNETFTRQLLEGVLGKSTIDLREPDEMSQSAICEIGNIMCCSYINAIASMTGMQIHVSVPSSCTDMAGSLLSVPMIHFAQMGDELLFIENCFRINACDFVSHVLFLPELSSIEHLLERLGVS